MTEKHSNEKDGSVCEDAGFFSTAHGSELLEAVRLFAAACGYERQHSEQVAFLAVDLFDLLAGIHGYGGRERFRLEAAGVLHDIGWVYGQQKHHKNAMQMILADREMPLGERDRAVIAQIARYHRKALPRAEHAAFQALSQEDRKQVLLLGGILRVADGLDRTHTNAVAGLSVEITDRELKILCQSDGPIPAETAAGMKKSDLLAESIGREIRIENKTL